jgi:hypothetical protein
MVVGQPQQRDEVLYVPCLEILQASVLHERDIAAPQLDLQQRRIVVGPVDHGLLAQLGAFLTRREHALTHRSGLLGFIAGEAELRCGSALALRPQRLAIPIAILLCNCVSDREDRCGRAVVLLELHDMTARELIGELEDVPGARRAEPVDRLKIVAHDGQAGAPLM